MPSLTELLSDSGFVAAADEAGELMACAQGDQAVLEGLVERRIAGEPLSWIVGRVVFCGVEVLVHPGVYVPRWQSEPLTLRAVERLPANGRALDLCTGSGAIAKVVTHQRPDARVVATDIDEGAVACARANGADAHLGDLFEALPDGRRGPFDVIVAVVPYVPTSEMALLPRGSLTHESPLSYDGGPDGTDILRRVVVGAPMHLRTGGSLLLELGGDQDRLLDDHLRRFGFADPDLLFDEDGDLRGIEAVLN